MTPKDPSTPARQDGPVGPPSGGLSLEARAELLDHIEEHVYVIDRDFNLRYANRALLQSKGLAEESLRGLKCHWLMHGLRSPCGESGMECGAVHAMECGQPWRGCHAHFDEAGREHPQELEFLPFQTGESESPLVLVISRDVTKLERAKVETEGALDQLRQEEELFTTGPVVVFKWKNVEGWPVEFVSPNVEATFGYSAEELLSGMPPYSELVVPEDLPRVGQEVVDNSAAGADHFTHEPYRITRKDGAVIWIFDQTTIVRNRAGEITNYLGYIIDITAYRRLEDEQKEMARRLRHTQKLESLGVLAGGIAHDFNNLLTAILGNADLALNQLSPVSPARENIQSVIDAGRRAADLANQMLAYSGKGRFLVQSLQLEEIIAEMAHLLAVSISKQVTLEYEFAGDVANVEADATQIRQIVMNLITNASESVADTGGMISVATGSKLCDRPYLDSCHMHDQARPGMYSYLEVKDTGSGMDAETLTKLFDPFFTTKFTGRGLGMSAVLGIVRGHAGAIRVDSKLGRGTTIRVLLPATDEPSSDPAAGLHRDSPADAFLGATILVVDDEESVRAVARRMLENGGYEVLVADDGEQAVARLKDSTHTIDCVLLDLTMPKMGGEQAFRELRRAWPDLPIVMCSGYSEQDVTERFAGQGLSGFIKKPFRTEILIAEIRRALADSERKSRE